jgi:hypothetical protein
LFTQNRTNVHIVHSKQTQNKLKTNKEKQINNIKQIYTTTQSIEPFRQIGYLYGPDKVMMPLLGRRTYQRSIRFNYYTLSNHENPIKIPIVKERDCMDETGCAELFDGDLVFIKELDSQFTIKIYDKHGLRYNPDYI